MNPITDNSRSFVNFILGASQLIEKYANLNGEEYQEDKLKSYPRSCFIDGNRELPVFDKTATFWSSVAALSGEIESNESQREKLAAAAKFFGITEDVESAVSAFNEKVAADREDPEAHMYALQFEKQAGQLESYYPIDDEDNLMTSIRFMDSDRLRGNLPEYLYKTSSFHVVKRARELGCYDRIPGHVKVAGEVRIGDVEAGSSFLFRRAKQTGKEGYAKLAKAYVEDSTELLSPEDMAELTNEVIKLACKMDSIYGNDTYNAYNQSPVLALNIGPTIEDVEKQASSVFVLGDVAVPIEALSNMNWNELSGRVSSEGAKSLSSLKEAFEKEASLERSIEMTKIAGALGHSDKKVVSRYVADL